MPKTIPSVGRYVFLRAPVIMWHLLYKYVVGTFRIVSILFLLILGTVIFAFQNSVSAAGTLNFQARLLTSSGSVAPDGVYNVEFKLYDQETLGTELWTETRLTTDASNLQVTVKSGYLSVYLGDKTAFPSSIDWNNQHYLTMNIGDTTGTPAWDGEMTPRIRLTAVPFAFQADRANTADAIEDVQGSNIGSLAFDTLTANRTILLPDASGTVALLQNAQTFTGAITFGATGTGLTVTNDASVGGALTSGSLSVTNAASIGGNLAVDTNTLFVNATTNRVGIGTSSPGARLSVVGAANEVQVRITGNGTQTSDLLQLLNSTSDILSGFNANGQLYLNNSGFTGTLETATLTANRTYTLPDADGTFCLTSGNCAGVGGQVGGTGTAGRIAVFTTVSDIDDSYLLQDAGGIIIDTGKDLTVDTDTLFVDGTTSRVGIGTTTPDYKLDVSGGTGIVARFSGRVIGGEAVNGDEFVTLDQLNNAVGTTGAFVQGGNDFGLGVAGSLGMASNESLSLITNGIARLTIAADGSVSVVNALTVGTGLTVTTGGADITGNLTVDGNITISNAGTFTSGTGAVTLQGNTEITGINTFTVGTGATTLGGTLEVDGTTTFNGNVVIAAQQSITLTGGNTASRPAFPTEGMLYFDTTTKQLLTYANGKWNADKGEYTIVAASNSSQSIRDAAHYVAGATSAQTIINQALTEAAGGKVYLAQGTYNINASISIPNNTTLAGAGRGTLIELANVAGATVNAIVNSDTTTGTGITIQDLRLDGRNDLNTTGTQSGIFLTAMGAGSGATARQGAKLTNLWANSFRSEGIRLESSSNNTVSGNTAQGNTSYGIYLNSSSNNTVSGNTAQGNTSYGIYLNSSSNNTFTGNTTQGNSSDGISLQSSSNNNTVSGNTAQGNSFDGIYLSSSSNNTITGNTAQGNSSVGIRLDNSSNNTVSGNKLHDNGGATTNNAIYLSTSSSNTITGNSITDTSATTNNFAINISNSTSDTNYLADNTLGGGSVNDVGTGTIYGGQVNSSGNFMIQPTGTIELLRNTNVTGTLSVSGLATFTTLGTANTDAVLCRNTTNQLATCSSTFATTANAFLQGGNSFGAAAVLGTNDANDLIFRTNNTNRLTLDTSGSLQFLQASTISTSTGALTVTPATGNNFNVNLSGAGDFAVNTNQLYVDTSTGNVGIGTTIPGQKLDVAGSANLTGQLYLPSTSFADQSGIIYKGGSRFIHNFNYGNNGTVTTIGNNTFIGLNSGNFTMGSTATQTYEASYNTAVGVNTLQNNTTGYSNTAAGYVALQNNTTGSYNTANGYIALRYNTTGNNNTANGSFALQNNTTGNNNTANGQNALYGNTTGSFNTALGHNAGRYIADGSTANTTSNNSLYLGNNTKALADGGSNEIVIGYNATGNGSNSVTLGSTAVTKTVLQGSVGIGTTVPGAFRLNVQGGDVNFSGSLTVGGSGAFTGRVSGADAVNNDEFVTLGQAQTLFASDGNYFVQAGNGFGETAVIGTTDTFGFNLQTDSVTRVAISATGDVAFDTDTLFVDATNNRVQVGSSSSVNARLSVIGGADQTQLLVRANATQSFSNPLVLLQDSAGSELARINATANSLYFGNGAGGSTASGANNIGIGASALGAVSTGTANTTLGSGALASVSMGSNNTAVGYNSGNLLTGSNNILLGYGSGSNLENGSNNIIIGYNLGASSATAENELRIGGILQGDTSTLAAQFNGELTVTGKTTLQDKLTVTTGGADITGNVTLTSDLAVNGGDITSTGVLTVTPGAGTNFNVNLSTTGDFAVNTNQLYVDTSTGNVGIGTVNPSYSLSFGGDVARTIKLENRITNAIGNNLTVAAGNAGAGASAFAGGGLILQGGAAGGTGNANGGAITIAGGAGIGTGTQGLINLSTTAFSSAAVQIIGSGGTTPITAGNVDLYSTIPLSVTTTSVIVTVPDPDQTSVIGRIIYISARSGSDDFTLRLNAARTPIDINMKANSTATLIWNGTDWTAAGASSSTDLQAAYNNTVASAGGAELVLNAPGGNADGFTIRNNATTPILGGILEVQSSIGTNLFSVNNFGTELAANGGAETSATFATDWTGTPAGGSAARTTTSGQYLTGQAGAAVTTTATTLSGVRNNLSGNPVNTIGAEYQVSFAAKSTLNGTQVQVRYSRNGGTNYDNCTTYGTGLAYATLSDTTWTKVTCTVTISSATAASNPDLMIEKIGATTPTIYIDNLSFIRNDTTTQPSNVQIGGGINGGQVTLFTLDRSSAPPVANGNDTYLGSMYYDTTTGRIQCYEADGWGACGSPPDNIITLTPEYTGAVLNGTGIGTMTADFCANQTTVLVVGTLCASGNSRQFYKWTSPQATQQTYSIYVSYKLPSTFKAFNDDDTITLTALTNNTTNGFVTYEVFRSSGTAITACGSETTVTSTVNTWQTVPINGNETSCSFAGGDNIIFKINTKTQSNATVYVENLNFTYTNN